MNYILSKYTFAVSKRTSSGQEICLLFSGRTGKNILVSKKVFSIVENGKFTTLQPKVLEILISEKVLVPSTEDELDEINKENKVRLSKKSTDRLYVSIQPTAACQLACDYCGQAHSRKFLTDSLIEQIVCRIQQKLSLKETKSLEIGWFGGEPLMAFSKMKKLNEQLKDIAISRNLKYTGHITTNGYALSPSIYKILKEEFNVYRIEITLDGSKEFHDKRRVTTSGIGSFDIIFNNLKAITQSPFYDKNTCVISIRCNVDERNIEGVMPLLEMLYKHNMQDKIIFYTTPVVSWSNNGAGSMLGHKLLGKLSSKHIDYMINHNFKVTILPKRVAPYQCIGTDNDAEMYDADGNVLDCSETSYSEYYKSKGFVLGNVEQKENVLNKRSCLHDVPQMLLEKRVQPCNNCKFYPLCGGLCPLGLLEKEPRCPSFIYNIEDRIYLDYLAKVKNKKMNIIQSFFNKRITLQNLNYRGGYLSSFVFWLSIAYSCLLLKRNNPTLRLLFYGNETIVHILKDLFKLPYDKFYICDYNDDYNDWFYCWPKILTYQRQKEPFIHIDSDIFMWTPIPEALLEAPLVAQHKERDSNFYREVFNEIKKDNIQLPQYMQNCIGDKYISSFNAGIIGGNDLLFLQRYINHIINFVSENKGKLDKASRKFLYNVVFEQWLYYGMTTFEHKEVCTYYKKVITDFDMQEATVPIQTVSGTPLKYMHVMEYKDNIRCNRFIVYNMLNDFPKEYKQILKVCAEIGIDCPTFSSDLASKKSLRLEKLKSLTNLTKLESEELNAYETLKENYKKSFLKNRKELIKMQQHQIQKVKLLQNSLISDEHKLNMELSHTLKFVECKESLLDLLVFKSKHHKPSKASILWVYNPILDKVDEFLWSYKKVQFLKELLREENANLLLLQAYGKALEIDSDLNTFIRQCVFDGIINIEKNENSPDIL